MFPELEAHTVEFALTIRLGGTPMAALIEALFVWEHDVTVQVSVTMPLAPAVYVTTSLDWPDVIVPLAIDQEKVAEEGHAPPPRYAKLPVEFGQSAS